MLHHQSQRLPGKFIIANHKPVLWYVKGFRRGRTLVPDVLRPPQREKDDHEWGQGEGGVTHLIEHLTEPGELIVDPFAGTAMWGRIAADMGRRWIGADIAEGGTTNIVVDEPPPDSSPPEPPPAANSPQEAAPAQEAEPPPAPDSGEPQDERVRLYEVLLAYCQARRFALMTYPPAAPEAARELVVPPESAPPPVADLIPDDSLDEGSDVHLGVDGDPAYRLLAKPAPPVGDPIPAFLRRGVTL
jgi:hypothetical protein